MKRSIFLFLSSSFLTQAADFNFCFTRLKNKHITKIEQNISVEKNVLTNIEVENTRLEIQMPEQNSEEYTLNVKAFEKNEANAWTLLTDAIIVAKQGQNASLNLGAENPVDQIMINVKSL